MVHLAYKESQTDGWFLVYRLQEQWGSLSFSMSSVAISSSVRPFRSLVCEAKRFMAHSRKVLTVLRHALAFLTILYK